MEVRYDILDTELMELGRKHPTKIHNTRSLIRTLKYVLDILQTKEAFTVEEYKHTRTHIHTHTHANTKIMVIARSYLRALYCAGKIVAYK